jgi:hypothetical protein
MRMNHLICDCNIVYDNGAIVRTSFVTSYGGDTIIQTCPELSRRVNATVERLRKETVAQLPKYEYPDHIITAAILQRWAHWESKKAIFGGGLLLSERAAAERAAAERAGAHVWELSEREMEIVKLLG